MLQVMRRAPFQFRTHPPGIWIPASAEMTERRGRSLNEHSIERTLAPVFKKMGAFIKNKRKKKWRLRFGSGNWV